MPSTISPHFYPVDFRFFFGVHNTGVQKVCLLSPLWIAYLFVFKLYHYFFHQKCILSYWMTPFSDLFEIIFVSSIWYEVPRPDVWLLSLSVSVCLAVLFGKQETILWDSQWMYSSSIHCSNWFSDFPGTRASSMAFLSPSPLTMPFISFWHSLPSISAPQNFRLYTLSLNGVENVRESET